MDCDEAWSLITAVSMRMRQNNFNPDSLKEWPTGTLHRILLVIRWAANIHNNYGTAHYWMGKEGNGGIDDLNLAMLTELRSRTALRQVNTAKREVWITPFNGEILDELDLESINNCQEVRKAFPEALANTVGYPVVCWNMDLRLDSQCSTTTTQ